MKEIDVGQVVQTERGSHMSGGAYGWCSKAVGKSIITVSNLPTWDSVLIGRSH